MHYAYRLFPVRYSCSIGKKRTLAPLDLIENPSGSIHLLAYSALPVMILVSLNTPFELWLGLRNLLLHGLVGEVSLTQSPAL